jgi:hypothetical protein
MGSSSRYIARQQIAYFGVAGRPKIVIPLPDGVEFAGRLQAYYFDTQVA